MASLVAWVLGLVFAFGLGISGLVRPEVIQGGLDVTGDFDPSLLISFASSVACYAPLAWFAKRRTMLANACQLPTRRRVDLSLILGAGVFGIGWGLAGTCPGPAVVWLATARPPALLFAAAMLVGMALASLTQSWAAKRAGAKFQGDSEPWPTPS